MSRYLTAAQAAAALGISVPTLYSYVSRGMLRSAPEAIGKRRLYAAEEVRRLARRKADGKRAGTVAQKVLDWGVPVLESSITLIADGHLFYRGHNAIELARAATLEETASLLWACDSTCFRDTPDAPIDQASWQAWLDQTRAYAPHERALVMLPAAAAHLPRLFASNKPEQRMTAVTLLRVLAGALGGSAPSREPLHRQLAAAWGIDDPGHIELLRAALVVCADHELNASAFTVRCIASTGMHLFGAVTGGLAALAGPRHCGETMLVTAMFREATQALDIDRYLAARVSSGDIGQRGQRTILPGFGHMLYPDGDPRCALLLDMLRQHAVDRAERQRLADIEVLVGAACEVTDLAPTVDFGLSALERVLGLPPGAAFSLFALGRAVGWIAHAMEQFDDGRLIRPRARYVGPDELMA